MTRYVAFLRAINVGGHTVKMETLREHFESLGFARVETFIASGNVLFEADDQDTRSLENLIEQKLQAALGYKVATFLRTPEELSAIASYRPFPQPAMQTAAALNVAFLADPLDSESQQKLMALRSEIDEFHVHGREVYWLCLKRQSQSTFSNAVLEKTIRRQSTLRGLNTVQKIAAHIGAVFADHQTATYVWKVREVRFLAPQVPLLRAVVGMLPPGKADLNLAVNAIQTLLAVRSGGVWLAALLQSTPAQFHGHPEAAQALTDELRQLL